MTAARLQRWGLILMAHNYVIKYRKSADRVDADILSRFPDSSEQYLAAELEVNYFSYKNDLPVSAQLIKEETRKDPILSKVLHCVQNGWPKHNEDDGVKEYFVRSNELNVDRGCLQWVLRAVISPRFQENCEMNYIKNIRA